MEYWDKLKKDIINGISESFSSLKDVSTGIKERVYSLASEGKTQIETHELKKKIEDSFSLLGKKVFEILSGDGNDVNKDTLVKSLVGNLSELKSKLAEQDEKSKTKAHEEKPAVVVILKSASADKQNPESANAQSSSPQNNGIKKGKRAYKRRETPKKPETNKTASSRVRKTKTSNAQATHAETSGTLPDEQRSPEEKAAEGEQISET